jgi:hypothetical protein
MDVFLNTILKRITNWDFSWLRLKSKINVKIPTEKIKKLTKTTSIDESGHF